MTRKHEIASITELTRLHVNDESEITVGGAYKVRFFRSDSHVENPYDFEDYLEPMIAYLHGHSPEAMGFGDSSMNPIRLASPDKVFAAKKVLLQILFGENSHEWESKGTPADASASAKWHESHSGTTRADAWQSVFAEAFDNFLGECVEASSPYSEAVECVNLIVKTWNAVGFRAFGFAAHGYSQGDYINGVVIETPQHVENCGYDQGKHDFAEAAKNHFDRYAAWVFGNHWRMEILDSDGSEFDSCGGLIGEADAIAAVQDSVPSQKERIEHWQAQVKERSDSVSELIAGVDVLESSAPGGIAAAAMRTNLANAESSLAEAQSALAAWEAFGSTPSPQSAAA